MNEVDIIIQGPEAVALVGQEVIARVSLTMKDAPEKLLRQLHDKGYSARQIQPSPDGSHLTIWI
jgi:hypothetical protein